MPMSAEHRSIAALHRQWWRLHMSEKFPSGTINSIKTNMYQIGNYKWIQQYQLYVNF